MSLNWLRSQPYAVPLPVIVFFDLPHFLTALLFSDLIRYLVFSLVALLLLSGWLVQLTIREGFAALRHKRTYLLAFGVLAVLAFPFLLQYQPSVIATSTAEMRMVEQPNFLTGVVRRNMVFAEKEGCFYEPLGWADTQTLVYRKWCGGFYDQRNNYQWNSGITTPPLGYQVDSMQIAPYIGDLAKLKRDTCAYSSCVLPLLEKDYVHTWPPNPRYPDHFDDSVRSPDGKWIAFKAKYVYGPEDLLVISTP
jgi:hypothetical protein